MDEHPTLHIHRHRRSSAVIPPRETIDEMHQKKKKKAIAAVIVGCDLTTRCCLPAPHLYAGRFLSAWKNFLRVDYPAECTNVVGGSMTSKSAAADADDASLSLTKAGRHHRPQQRDSGRNGRMKKMKRCIPTEQKSVAAGVA